MKLDHERFKKFLWTFGLVGMLLLSAVLVSTPVQAQEYVTAGRILCADDASFYAEGRYWIFYDLNIPNRILYTSSTDGVTWNAGTEILSGMPELHRDIYYDGQYVHIVCFDAIGENMGVKYRKGDPNPDGTISWLADWDVAVEGVGEQFPLFPRIVVIEGYPWLIYSLTDYGTMEAYLYALPSTTNDGTFTASGFGTQIGPTLSDDYGYIDAVYMGSGVVSVVFSTGTQVLQRTYDGATWLSQVTISSTSNVYYLDLKYAGDGKTMTLYSDGSNVNYALYDLASNSIVDSGILSNLDFDDNAFGLSYDWDTGDLYAFGYDRTTETKILKQTYSGGSWSGTTEWITIPADYDNYQGKIYPSDMGYIGMALYLNADSDSSPHIFFATEKTLSSYLVYGSSGPSVDSIEAPSTVYAYSYFWLNMTISDPEDVANIEEINITIGDVVIGWNASGTREFEILNGSEYVYISQAYKEDDTTSADISIKMRLEWSFPEGDTDVIVDIYTSGSAEPTSHTESALFYFEDDLRVVASARDSIVNPGASIWFDGYVYYEGTTRVPDVLAGITVYLEYDGETICQTITFRDDVFSLMAEVPWTVGSYQYTIYAMTDDVSVENATVEVIVDELVVNDIQEDIVNDTIYVQVLSVYDGSPATGTVIEISGVQGTVNATGWAVLDMSSSGAVNYLPNIRLKSNPEGLTTFSAGLVYYTKVLYGDSFWPFEIRSDHRVQDLSWDGSHLMFSGHGTICVKAPALDEPDSVLVNGAQFNYTYDDATNTVILQGIGSDVEIIWESSAAGGDSGGYVPSEGDSTPEDGGGGGAPGDADGSGDDSSESGTGDTDEGESAGGGGIWTDPWEDLQVVEVEDISQIVIIGLVVIFAVMMISRITGGARRQ